MRIFSRAIALLAVVGMTISLLCACGAPEQPASSSESSETQSTNQQQNTTAESVQTSNTTADTLSTVSTGASSSTTSQVSSSSTTTTSMTIPSVPDNNPSLTKELKNTDFIQLAGAALEDIYAKFWTDKNGGHIVNTHGGQPISGRPTMIWESAMLMLCMENYYYATKDAATKDKMIAHWTYLKDCFTEEQMIGMQGKTPNLAADDAGWDAMLYIAMYRIAGDTAALRRARLNILQSYDYWMDGSLQNGMWYCDPKLYNGDQWKSVYCASFLISALDYLEVTAGTSEYDADLYKKTMDLYVWMQENLCRDAVKTYQNGLQNGNAYTVSQVDHLYWVDFNINRSGRTEKNGPDGGVRPLDIKFEGSVSSLFGNMAMAAVNAKLYRMTGQNIYLDRATKTVSSITRYYTQKDTGGYLNDRDHGTNAAFLYYYITDVLTLPTITQQDRNVLALTGRAVAQHGKRPDGYYNTSWTTNSYSAGEEYLDLTRMATSVAMITGSALGRSLNLF